MFLIDVEGTLHGLSRTSGTLLWSTPLSSPLNSNPTPLLSTTITTGTITFIPSITGSIHLPRDPNSNPNPNLNNSDQKNKKINNVRSTNEVVYDTVSVRDLVSRSPFVDYQGRVFAGSKRGQAVGVDYRNGVVKKVVDGGGVFDVVDEDSDSYNEDNYGEEEFIVWVGRNDYDVTVYDIHSGRIESLFSSSEVLSSKEMLSLAEGEARESEEQETSSIRLLATVQGAIVMGILSSWVPPVVALIFVVSFEMGRRKRLQHLKVDNPVSSSSSSSSLEKINNDEQPQPQSLSSSKQIGSITLSSTILGYGCHGTVVFLGSLHNRKIAVKRMLSAYDASASNEIDLLCRTDDHANLIRYFMRETDGEFVYLALELCDKSLLDAVEGGICGGEVGALEEIVKGVDHLHNMRIIHRDIKPQNILMRKKGKEQKHFGDYLMKISDMGLGKVVGGGQSGSSMGGGGAGGVPSSTGGGGGAGSVGWQAQEVIKQKLERVASSENLGESAGGSAVRVSSRSRFASDIFSLGCLFQFVLLPGSHPFGSFYERENNIILGKPVELRKLLSKNPLAYNLVKSMVQHDYKLRPTASQVLKHPFFWSKTKRMQFICDFSDRLEIEGAVSKLGLKVEVAAADIISTNFTNKMEPKLLNDAAKYRSYDPASVVDCLRFIRNKRNHEDSIPSDVKQKIGSLWEYFENLFPGLVGRCWEVSKKELSAEDEFCKRWELDGEGVGVEADSNSHLNNVDPRFRTRLCTNWLASNGTSCAMKDKGKCIFAHSPCELRVKEGKRARWGKLINKETGYSSNLLASGGEDTYGAAIGVESMREQEGKWGGGGGQGGRRGGRGRGGGRYGGRGGRGRGKCY
ncbi:hypothetical protein TL16_g10947 [Triparma laevis f. inornata]|uniref:non-specific serine/threonine protein kinase n=1 Tax=Triparma laevis f. inornata TaxID=1714386 RepID=A0A9W7BBS3_9STRA|nr:hypothetical protein TL16_g10947 [Triparma laevis f. inornata]